MAITVASTTTLDFATGSTSTVISRPSGTTDGDFLVVYLAGITTVSTVPSGWTLIKSSSVNNGTDTFAVYAYYKFANSEPSTWTWTWAGNQLKCGGAIRVTGVKISDPVGGSNDDNAVNTTSPSFNNTVTQSITDSLVLYAIGTLQNSNGISGFAIANDDPTWTTAISTLFDPGEPTPNTHFKVAYAIRTPATATGNSSAAAFTSITDSVAQIVVINRENAFTSLPTESVTLTDTSTIVRVLQIQKADTVTVSDTNESAKGRQWRKETKPTTIWRPEDK